MEGIVSHTVVGSHGEPVYEALVVIGEIGVGVGGTDDHINLRVQAEVRPDFGPDDACVDVNTKYEICVARVRFHRPGVIVPFKQMIVPQEFFHLFNRPTILLLIARVETLLTTHPPHPLICIVLNSQRFGRIPRG